MGWSTGARALRSKRRISSLFIAVKDGKIVESWFIVDTFKLFQDTGVIPPAATPAA